MLYCKSLFMTEFVKCAVKKVTIFFFVLLPIKLIRKSYIKICFKGSVIQRTLMILLLRLYYVLLRFPESISTITCKNNVDMSTINYTDCRKMLKEELVYVA